MCSGGAPTNKYRQAGSSRYAQPPPGTYGQTQPPVNPAQSFLPPPFADGAQSMPPPPTAKPSDVGIPTAYVSPAPSISNTANDQFSEYTVVTYHWFYRTKMDIRQVWMPFSHTDSFNLEQAISS